MCCEYFRCSNDNGVCGCATWNPEGHTIAIYQQNLKVCFILSATKISPWSYVCVYFNVTYLSIPVLCPGIKKEKKRNFYEIHLILLPIYTAAMCVKIILRYCSKF